jgi:hypothetical protein
MLYWSVCIISITGLQCRAASETLATELSRLSLQDSWQTKHVERAIDVMHQVVSRLMYDLLIHRAQLLTHFQVHSHTSLKLHLLTLLIILSCMI